MTPMENSNRCDEILVRVWQREGMGMTVETVGGMETSSSAMAERPRELDQRFQMGSQFEAIID